MAIDHFLRSLAEDCGGRAIGVILSGTASDGALGLTAIKAAGGLTFAQDPDSAKYDGMPRSAVACGAVDIVLPAAAIGRELARLAAHPYIRQSDFPCAVRGIGGGQAFAGIFRILQRETGVDFTHYRQTTVRRRIARRMIVHKLDTLEAYHRHLKEHPAEAPALCIDLLISVTSFFRDADTFRVLQRKVFPRLVKRPAAAPPIRVWVPACATGEEAYSLAIALLESLGLAAGPPLVQIFGTDLSETAITHARAGVYARNIELDISPERLRRFFVKLDGQYQVSKSVRELCVFAKHDLAQDPPFSRVDLISCRNVLIYLEAKLQKRVMSVLHYASKNEGVLLLGAAETVARVRGPLHRRRPAAQALQEEGDLRSGSTEVSLVWPNRREPEPGQHPGPLGAASRWRGGSAAAGRSDRSQPVRAGRRPHQRRHGDPPVPRAHQPVSRAGPRPGEPQYSQDGARRLAR